MNILSSTVYEAAYRTGRAGCNKTVLVAFEIQQQAAQPGARIALFPGAFNPPTIAHVAIARAALDWADHVVWVLPRDLPHKTYDDVSFADRMQLLESVTAAEPRFLSAATDGGLYIDIARQARAALGEHSEIALVCGRDAAERIAAWDYGRQGVFDEIVSQFPLLVASRAGQYEAGLEHHGRIIPLRMESSFDDVSSSGIRSRIARAEPWRQLVPEPIRESVAKLYT